MAETLVSPGIAMHETDQSAIAAKPLVAGAALVGPTIKGQVLVPTKVTSYGEYVRNFGDTFETKIFSGSNGTPVQQEFMTSLAAKSFFEQGGESLLVTRVACADAFKFVESTIIHTADAEAAAPFKLYTLGQGAIFNSNNAAEYVEYTEETSGSASERKDGSLIYGTANSYRFEITNVNEEQGTFTLVIRKANDTAKEQSVLETWNNLSLDPNSPNYIAAVIGDQYANINANNPADVYVESRGNYPNKSAFVRVEVLRPTPNYLATDGETINEDAEGNAYSTYLPKQQRGAFYTANAGEVGVPYYMSGSVLATGSNTEVAYFENISLANTKFPQSVTRDDYHLAFALLENTDEYQINVVSAPGLLGQEIIAGVGELISLAEDRQDCIAVADLVHFGETPAGAADIATAVNSSYAAAYWPWLQMYSATGKLVWVPASVVIPGIYAYNDHAAAPWYAPAGMTRGGVSGVVQTEKKLTKQMRDILYQKNINPIATLPGAGIVIYGQKTLQKKASALDRVNVRRLLIEVKEKVKNMASGLLFEQNTTALQNSFKAQLDPYLSSVVQRNGLYAYKIDLSGNTNDAIDRNEFHCSIYLQPTKVVEFIYLDFIITPTGVEFN